MPRKIKGLRRHGAGWQTYCRVDGEFLSESWPLDTPTIEMTTWLREHRAKSTRTRSSRDVFETDAASYLEKVKAMPSIKDRTRHITEWATLFAGRRRKTITSAEIRGHRDQLLVDGLAGGTVNKKLRALSNLWTVLDGRRKPNPVRDVPECDEPDPEPRAIPYALLRQILDALPERGHTAVAGTPVPNRSKTKARLRLMAWTGLAHIELAHLQRRDWDEAGATLFVRSRRKGSGGTSRQVPLIKEARAAMTAFDEAGAWGAFQRSSLYQSFKRACRSIADLPETPDALKGILLALRPYDIRHSFATAVYTSGGDAHAASKILGHSSRKTIDRYIKAGVAPRVQLAMEGFEAATRKRRAPGSATISRRAPVAQRIEHRTSNPRAAGSSPAGRANSQGRKLPTDRARRRDRRVH